MKKFRKEHNSLITKRSKPPAGLGLFTTVPIKKDAFVIEYGGELIKTEEADERGTKYLFDIDKKWTIDGAPRYNRARYINHSCKPNCEAEIDGKRVFIYAKRAIEAGEELSYDYGKEYCEEYVFPKCSCGHCDGKGKKKDIKKKKR